ncbi:MULTISPECIES: phosphatase PAP2 family protein [Anaerolinea]|uniref:phosphatase PAP2 family protein n=1 Tax=Anaerolinea TaxID=233189 RepID=UPI0026232E4C|nr:phosphatase PAP2 family protein [Anaerolinea thermophila]
MGSSFWQSLQQWDDRWTSRLTLKPGRGPGWYCATFLAHSGDSWLWVGALGVIWLLTSDSWHRRAALLAAAVGIQALTVFALKQFIRRPRPEGEWGAIYRNVDPHSFPSGHAVRAALLAVMAVGLGPQWFAALLLIWAPLVSLARVATGVHYLSDVLAGMLLGTLMGVGMLALSDWLMQLFPFFF